MNPSAPKVTPCDATTRLGRLAKANQFMAVAVMAETLAEEADDLIDSVITLAVHAGIAAADVICCARLGRHAHGQNHTEAVALLHTADPGSRRHLSTLLGMKTKAGYSPSLSTVSDQKRAMRAAEALLSVAKLLG